MARAIEERELLLTREAIAMVASGASPRVIVAGIRFGEQILESARASGRDCGVEVVRILNTEGVGSSLAFEPIQE
jgi:hypothetical protein